MLVIRKEQIEHFERVLEARYLDRACRYLQEDLSSLCKGMTEKDLREYAAAAFRRAFGYGMRTQGEHLGYLTVAAVLGWEFHTEARYAWVGECLANPLLGSPAGRIRNVLEAVSNGLDEPAGEEVGSRV